MLVLTRKKNEAIVIGDAVITVVEIRDDKVRLGVQCPMHMPVHRKEVYDAIHQLDMVPPRPAEEAAFLQAVLETPDDDGIRLIFADWLEERNDPYGEFIRIQVQLYRQPIGDPTRDALRQREQELLFRHGTTWRSYLPGLLHGSDFRRGFVESVKTTINEFLRNADLLFAATPLRLFSALPNWPADLRQEVKRLAASPHLGRLRGLALERLGLGDEEAAVLAGTAALASLDLLDLRENRIGATGAESLASSPHLDGIKVLLLYQNPVGDRGTAALRRRFGERVRL